MLPFSNFFQEICSKFFLKIWPHILLQFLGIFETQFVHDCCSQLLQTYTDLKANLPINLISYGSCSVSVTEPVAINGIQKLQRPESVKSWKIEITEVMVVIGEIIQHT